MKIKSICIVGGGSSGWMMAVALNKQIPHLKVTLVESPNVPVIGVGESTIPYTTNFFKNTLGFKEQEWMPFCDATYKASIRFNNFTDKESVCHHPFWTQDENTLNSYDWAIKKELTNLDKPSTNDYFATNFIAYHMSLNNKFDCMQDEEFAYAHHIDAIKFGQYCKTQFKGEHILATVKHVKSNGSTIESVTTNKGIIEADMFVDCTGLKALLIDGVLNEPFESRNDTLLNDTAITCRMPYSNKSLELEPFTDCTALSSGWVWNAPLWSRIGTGYVFSSKFQSHENALKEFNNYLIKRFDKKRVDKAEFNFVPFKTGKYKRGWVNNCLALTLASGFIEPLESTGLAMTAYQIEEFIKQIKTSTNSAFSRASYNNELDRIFEDTYNFVLLHYANTNRNDSPYWQHIQNNLNITNDFVTYTKNTRSDWFDIKSKDCILIGMNYPSTYSATNLLWRDKYLNQYTKAQHTKILKELEYLKNRKEYYEEKTNEMLSVTDYLEKNIYTKTKVRTLLPEVSTTNQTTPLNISKYKKKLQKKIISQDGTMTFYDNLIDGVIRNDPLGLKHILELDDFLNESKTNRFCKYKDRLKRTNNKASIKHHDLLMSQGTHSLIEWKNLSLYKTAYDLIIYLLIIAEIKPTLIIEYGSGSGGSAVWFSDMAIANGLNTKICSYDIKKPSCDYKNIDFIEIDLQNSSPYLGWAKGQKKIIIEDAHVNVTKTLLETDKILESGDYLIVEDSGIGTNKQKEIAKFLKHSKNSYEIDQYYSDFFGKNVSCCVDSIFKVI